MPDENVAAFSVNRLNTCVGLREVRPLLPYKAGLVACYIGVTGVSFVSSENAFSQATSPVPSER